VTTLVTGGSGLVGSHVIEQLRARGERVRALVLERSRAAVSALGAEPVIGDVTDPDAWRRAASGVEAIVHAAALVQTRASFDEYRRVNVGGTRLAVETARRASIRLVHISSVAVYGGSADYRPTVEHRDEDYAFRPLAESDYYARSKRESEELVRELPAVALRPNVIYGERDRLFTPQILTFARFGFLPAVGPGTNHLSCVYAGNVAAAVLAALQRAPAGFRAYNVTADKPPALTEREFMAAFGVALGRRLPRLRLPALPFVAGMSLIRGSRLARAALSFVTGENPYVSDRIRHELGWEPPFGTAQAVERTVKATLAR
jgi:nucleoside-diphosphate-sugar epimerase